MQFACGWSRECKCLACWLAGLLAWWLSYPCTITHQPLAHAAHLHHPSLPLLLAGDSGEFDSPVLRLVYTSLTTPRSVIDHHLVTSGRAIKKVQPVLGGFDSSNYTTERLWATAEDGTKVRRLRACGGWLLLVGRLKRGG